MANTKSSKSNSKSNKTAHVLNLLTEPGETAEAPAQSKRPAQQQAADSHEVAESIRSALEEDLLAELEEEPAAAPAPAPAPAPQPPAAEPAAAPAAVPEPEPLDEPIDPGVTYLNVMQALVEDKVDKYMERFHMCTCERCRTDVIALTLTSLPAKYIVVPENEGVPMLTIYEGRYSAAVTAQLMWACQKVSEHPRHTPGDDGHLRLGAPRHDDII